MTSLPEMNGISRYGRLFKPFTGRNIKYYYVPMQGALTYTALSVNVMCPSLLLRGVHREAIINSLIFQTLLGTGLYFYGRQHLKRASVAKRISFSVFGAFTFTMASIQLWNTIRYFIGHQNLRLCAACGIGSGWALIILGRRYSHYVDSEPDL